MQNFIVSQNRDVIYCLLFTVKKFHVFYRLLHNCESFVTKFCDNVCKHDVKAGNRESFLGNEYEDVKQQNFFTVNNKKYMVL